MWNGLDLTGVMAIDTAFHPDAPTADLRLIGSVAAQNPKGIMEGMPSGRRPAAARQWHVGAAAR